MNSLRNQMSEGGGSSDDYSISELLMAKHLRKQVLVGIVIKIGVQFSGIDAIFYYSTLMFRHANVADPQMATVRRGSAPLPLPSLHTKLNRSF